MIREAAPAPLRTACPDFHGSLHEPVAMQFFRWRVKPRGVIYGHLPPGSVFLGRWRVRGANPFAVPVFAGKLWAVV